jgi:two-component system phosphate regulon response regulator PhoB
MAGATIMVVEDDPGIMELVQYQLQRDGYVVRTAVTLAEANKLLRRGVPALLLLDLMLSDGNGLDFCRELRRRDETRRLPVIMMTARDDEADVVSGLEVGADDYVTKPFSPRVLLARVRAVLRRREAEEPGEEEFFARGPVTLDRVRHVATAGGEPLTLTRSEFALLELLARRPGAVFSRYQVVDAVHGSDYPVTDRSVDVLVVGLRRKLGACGSLIETVRGVGYCFRQSGEAS